MKSEPPIKKFILVQKGTLTGRVIELETQIVDMIVLEKSIVVATMDKCIHVFGFKVDVKQL